MPLEGWLIPAPGSDKLIIANHPMGFSRAGIPPRPVVTVTVTVCETVDDQHQVPGQPGELRLLGLEKAVWVYLTAHTHRGLSRPTAADTARVDCLSGVGQLEITCDDRRSGATACITVSGAQSPPPAPQGGPTPPVSPTATRTRQRR